MSVFSDGMMMSAGKVLELKGHTVGTSSDTTIPVDLPAEAQVGDLLLMVISKANAAASVSLTTPAGWTELWNMTGTGTHRRSFAAWRIVDGSEGGSVDVSVSNTGSGSWACVVFGTPEASILAGSTVNANTASPNPPNLAMSSSAETLFVACATIGGTSTVDVTAAPVGYDDLITSRLVTGTTSAVALAFKRAVAGSEDPGSFTLSGSINTVSNTLGVR